MLSRRPEAYHDGDGVEAITGADGLAPDLKKHVFYDWHRRMNLLDHFFHPATKLEDFRKAAYGEQGDFVTGEYSCKAARGPAGLVVSMARDGAVWLDGRHAGFRVEKDVLLKDDASWEASYRVSNTGKERAEIWFAPELVFSFSNPGVCPEGERRDIRALRFEDPVIGAIELSFSEPVLFWAFNLDTVSRSEEGIEKTYQGSVLAPGFRKTLEPAGFFEFTVKAKPC